MAGVEADRCLRLTRDHRRHRPGGDVLQDESADHRVLRGANHLDFDGGAVIVGDSQGQYQIVGLRPIIAEVHQVNGLRAKLRQDPAPAITEAGDE